MKFVFASERSRLVRERSQYLEKYNKNKSAYDEQLGKYNDAVANYSSNMETFIKSFLSAELEKLPDAKVLVKEARVNSSSDMYYIEITYNSEKVRSGNTSYVYNDYYHDVDSGRKRGLSWKFTIYLKDARETDSEGNSVTHRVLNKVPRINAEILDSDDYQELQATYNLFSKIDTIDWESVINQINNSVPKKESYVTVEDPGYKDTSKWDTAISAYNISRIIGKDIWIFVNITREESYDRWNSNNAGVDGKGWIRIQSATDKFYVFNWLESRYHDRLFSQNEITGASRRVYKLKKIYIHPIEPIEYASTEDLTESQKPHIDFGDDD